MTTRILGNIEQILRSEVRLFHVRVVDDVTAVLGGSALLAIGTAVLQIAALCVALGTMVALSATWPVWRATLVVSLACVAVGAVLIMAGRQQLHRLASTRADLFAPLAARPDDSAR